ncbi:transcription antitermination factor NusB [Agrilactobacillus yilanensis]|uniref:Transcription antitermination protein NusB n=1 Tax=Agrilactobacillus yilanensis TaxID=2485997 RepID=A0ABW4JA65_9LACO|nr:transcription antitermination factor NusB [Agrilactobacillus yilanensis]
MEVNQHNIRKVAFQVLFMVADGTDVDAKEAIEKVWVIVQHIKDDELAPLEIPPYLTALVTGVLAHKTELDEKIRVNLKNGWRLERLNRTDLTILRLGLFEILEETQLPNPVAINEAIELAKDFGDDTSRKFINGVLSNYVDTKDSIND